jgi:iron-sulfur cluster assembly protein
MLTITNDAADAIARTLEEQPGGAGLRIARGTQSMNGSGPPLQMQLAPEPAADDEVIEEHGVRLFVQPEAAEQLDGKVLDAEVEDGELHFALLDAD